MTDIRVVMEAARLRETWQCRALEAAKGVPRLVLMSVLIAEYPTALPTVMRVLGISDDDLLPALLGYAQIDKAGQIICLGVDRHRSRKWVKVYDNEEKLKYDFRKLADKIKLNDAERAKMFELIQKWVAQDLRYDHEGRKVLH